MTPKLASTGQTSTNQCLHVVVWIFAHKISLNWNRFHHVNLAIIALLVNLIFRFYNGSVWQTGRVWATILVPMEFFQPTLSFETKNSIFLSDGDTLKVLFRLTLNFDYEFRWNIKILKVDVFLSYKITPFIALELFLKV